MNSPDKNVLSTEPTGSVFFYFFLRKVDIFFLV